MKTASQINAARKRLRERIITPGLNDVQKSLIIGMVNALVWVAEGEASSTMERMLSDEPIAAGQDTKPAMNRFDAGLANLREQTQ